MNGRASGCLGFGIMPGGTAPPCGIESPSGNEAPGGSEAVHPATSGGNFTGGGTSAEAPYLAELAYGGIDPLRCTGGIAHEERRRINHSNFRRHTCGGSAHGGIALAELVHREFEGAGHVGKANQVRARRRLQRLQPAGKSGLDFLHVYDVRGMD